MIKLQNKVQSKGMPRSVFLCWRRWLLRLFLVLGLVALLLLSDGFLALPSRADIRQYHNGDGVLLNQSRRSLRDIDRQPWQVVVFQQTVFPQTMPNTTMSNTETHTELRLVGFPEQVTFKHPEALIIHTRTGQDWLAADEFSQFAPTASVGQFDVTTIVGQLPDNEPLMLELPTTPATFLKIPASLVQEWQLFS